MKKPHSLTLSTDLLELFDKLPMPRSSAITQALLNASREPDLMVAALRFRLSQPPPLTMVKVTYTRHTKLDGVIEKLSEMTKLPGEQVVRLCMEAYIHHL